MAKLRLCSISGCGKRHLARGYCRRHYSRWDRHGDPNYEPPVRLCSVEGCERLHDARGYCSKHLARVRTHGFPEAHRSFAQIEFINTIALPWDSEECCIWPFAIHSTGYAIASINGSQTHIHSYICELAHGPKPESGMHAAHRCGVRTCVSPKHVRWATPAENAHDRITHGTQTRGSQSNSRLTEADVIEIRALYEHVTVAMLSRIFGVHRHTIENVIFRRTWNWLE